MELSSMHAAVSESAGQQQQDEAAEDVSAAAQAVMWLQWSDAGLGLVAHCQFARLLFWH